MAVMTIDIATGILNRTSAKCAIKAIHFDKVATASNPIHISNSRLEIEDYLEEINDLFSFPLLADPKNQFHHSFRELVSQHELVETDGRGWHTLAPGAEAKADECFRNMLHFGANSLEEFFEALDIAINDQSQELACELANDTNYIEDSNIDQDIDGNWIKVEDGSFSLSNLGVRILWAISFALVQYIGC